MAGTFDNSGIAIAGGAAVTRILSCELVKSDWVLIDITTKTGAKPNPAKTCRDAVAFLFQFLT
ncbi:hypothetical protein [uncultured Thiodictyon sp.]|uniref:hypothetical protein n=1 Tax=uncultured Thiodictyon sp. TaxID=1846217 RepID=UPI0025DE00C2|nr:hypothetical protein [uncultured Thiodictyon sp.]